MRCNMARRPTALPLYLKTFQLPKQQDSLLPSTAQNGPAIMRQQPLLTAPCSPAASQNGLHMRQWRPSPAAT